MLSSTNDVTLSVIDDSLLEKIVSNHDVASLKPLEKVNYIKGICKSVGLNPITKPIQIIKFQGKEVLYFTKDATEQLRKINKVSITNIDTKILNESTYVVTAIARTPDGREDSSTGVIHIKGLVGDALANAMMKTETKAKRRVTLSICGLGFMDESELDTLPKAERIDVYEEKKPQSKIEAIDIVSSLSLALEEINKSDSENNLKETYTYYYKKFATDRDSEALKKIIEAKDRRRDEIVVKEFN